MYGYLRNKIIYKKRKRKRKKSVTSKLGQKPELRAKEVQVGTGSTVQW